MPAQTPDAYEHLWTAAGDTLRWHSFRIDREDRLHGVITTYPETSAQFFELWRPQPGSAYYWAESNLQTIPLEAKVTIQPVEGGGEYELNVQVDRLRYGLPERQIDNSAGALRLFSSEAPTTAGRMEKPSETSQMIPLGRDKPAEEQLLKSILDRYARPPRPVESTEEEVLIQEEPATTTTRPG